MRSALKVSRVAAALLALWLCAAQSHAGAPTPTFTAIPIGTNGTPRGYWEYLPAAHYADPEQPLPMVIFFHGLGEGGDGDGDLHEVLQNGPPEIANTPSHPLHNIFNDNDVILLAPQVTNNTWWNRHHIRAFLNHVLTRYPIDRTRLYFTGLSAGSSGMHDFMKGDVDADQVTAMLTVAVRGQIQVGEGDYLSPLQPYWALTAVGDASSAPINTVNRLAGFMVGGPTDVMDTYPGSSETRSANFLPVGGWTWSNGVNNASAVNPKLTLYPGSNHNSWDITYNNAVVWDWLLVQEKPSIDVHWPYDGHEVGSDDDLNLSAEVFDSNGVPITQVEWRSDIDGVLATATATTVQNLSPGVHRLELLAIDGKFTGHRVGMTLVVVSGNSDLIFRHGLQPYQP